MADQIDLLPDAPIDPSGLLAANLDAIPAHRWAHGLVQLIEVQEAVFVRLGYAPDEAFRLARAGVVALAEFGGGRAWYLPRGDDLHIATRDAEIWRVANRRNIGALAVEHGLTERQIWRICSQQRKLHVNKMQGRLFEDEGAK